MATVQTDTATKKPAATTEAVPPWYAPFNARIIAANGELGTPINPDQGIMGPAIGGPEGRPKRTTGTAAEALWLALVLRPEGCTKGQYITIKGSHGYAMNCLYDAGDTPSGARHAPLYRWVHVTHAAGGAYIARLTAKGADYARRLGLKAQAVERMAKPYADTPAKAPKAVKGDKPAKGEKATGTAGKPATPASKPAGALPAPAGTQQPATPKPATGDAKPATAAPAKNGNGNGKPAAATGEKPASK